MGPVRVRAKAGKLGTAGGAGHGADAWLLARGWHLAGVPRLWSLQRWSQHNPPWGHSPAPLCRVRAPPPLAVLPGEGLEEAEHPVPQGTAPRRPP